MLHHGIPNNGHINTMVLISFCFILAVMVFFHSLSIKISLLTLIIVAACIGFDRAVLDSAGG